MGRVKLGEEATATRPPEEPDRFRAIQGAEVEEAGEPQPPPPKSVHVKTSDLQDIMTDMVTRRRDSKF